MKVSDIRRKLAAALVAGGVLVPGAAQAADLNVNLLSNPGFENLDPGDSSILDWTAGTTVGFTYNSGVYDNGGPLAGGGNFYFSPNGGSDITEPGEVSQVIDISGGAAGSLIASGNAAYSLSGFFTSYLNDLDHGVLQVDFLDGGGTVLGSGSITPGGNLQTWTQVSGGGAIPVGTVSAFVSVYSVAVNGGPDGYMDNVEFRVTDEVILPALELIVDRTDGSLTLSNRTGSAVNLSGYQISSAFGGLQPLPWTSIAATGDADSGGSFDSQNTWSELTKPTDRGDLSEADLDSGLGAALGHTETLGLTGAGAWIQTSTEDVTFRYVSEGAVVQGIVSYEGGAAFELGDLDADGDLDRDDWAILRSGQHVDLAGLSLAEAYRAGDLTGDLQNNHADFRAFKVAFESANGVGSFAAMVSAVPEPSTALLTVTVGIGLLQGGRRRRDS